METNTNNSNSWAIASFICSIVGLFAFGIILGPLAIIFANKAKRTIPENEQVNGLADAGKIIGWIEVGIFLFAIIVALFCIMLATIGIW